MLTGDGYNVYSFKSSDYENFLGGLELIVKAIDETMPEEFLTDNPELLETLKKAKDLIESLVDDDEASKEYQGNDKYGN
jgi:hypothetical protein